MARVEKNADFYELVERAVDGLPPDIADLLDNVAIVVDDWPDLSSPLVPEGENRTLAAAPA